MLLKLGHRLHTPDDANYDKTLNRAKVATKLFIDSASKAIRITVKITTALLSLGPVVKHVRPP